MGWRLAEEVAHARPARPGPEWWTLLDIAQDARDDTRQALPGEDYLMDRAGCSRATLYRRLEKLQDAGLLIVAVRPAPGRQGRPGRRAVYEIPILHEMPAEAAIVAVEGDREVVITGDGVSSSEHSGAPNVSQSEPNVSHAESETPSVIPPVSLLNGSLINGSVEGDTASVGAAIRPEFDLTTRRGTDAARAYWANRLYDAESARRTSGQAQDLGGHEEEGAARWLSPQKLETACVSPCDTQMTRDYSIGPFLGNAPPGAIANWSARDSCSPMRADGQGGATPGSFTTRSRKRHG